MVTSDDADVIYSLKRAVCCPCHSIRLFIAGVLFGSLVAWATAIAGLYLADKFTPLAVAATPLAASVAACPPPVVDTQALAEVCMSYHKSVGTRK